MSSRSRYTHRPEGKPAIKRRIRRPPTKEPRPGLIWRHAAGILPGHQAVSLFLAYSAAYHVVASAVKALTRMIG